MQHGGIALTVGHKEQQLLNEPQIVCCNGCERPIAVHYEPIDCVMWCFDCSIDIEAIAWHLGIRATSFVIFALEEVQHNNLFQTCGFNYKVWKPKNNVTPKYLNEATTWGNDFTVTRCIAKLKTK